MSAPALRLVTLNFWGARPPLERRLAHAADQLRALAPDVLCLQEVVPVEGTDGRTTADAFADELAMHRVYEPAVRRADGTEEGLAILSRHAIAEHRATPLPDVRSDESRILLSARVVAPCASIWCHTTHLHWRLHDGLARERQVVAIDEVLGELAAAGAAPQILCGDFNAPPDADEIRFLRGLTTLAGRRTHYQDAWLRRHPGEPGLTWSAENPEARAMRTVDIDRRIDYVFVSSRHKDGRGTVLDCRVVLDRRDESGACASDHFAVLADVQIASD